MTRKTAVCAIEAAAIVVALGVQRTGAHQTPASPDLSADLVRQAQQAMRDGKEQDAVAMARKAVAAAPASFQAHIALGSMLDLAGDYPHAREAFAKAGEVAGSASDKIRARRATAISYAFERDCTNVARIDGAVYEQYLQAKEFTTAGEVANELARLCLDSANVDFAEQWYRKGNEAALKSPTLDDEAKDLWQFRLEHALGRIAARRSRKAEADRHVAAAKAVIDRGRLPEGQAEFFPYLQGYVALFTGDYSGALSSLQHANQDDPSVASLTAQACEKLGQMDKAQEYYRKVLQSTAHNPTTAASRPLARTKVKS